MPGEAIFDFKLYVVGEAPNSVQAISNLNALCRDHLPGRHHIEIVDVLLHPKRALAEGVLLTPTLVKVKPEPRSKIIGTLTETLLVLRTLGIPAIA
jgi:circadian clock protein KaiB